MEVIATAKASAEALKKCIARNRGEMRRLVLNLGAEAGLDSLQQRALEKARAEKLDEIASMARQLNVIPPDVKAVSPYPHVGSPVKQAGGAWGLDPVLAKAFNDAARTARSSLTVPPKRSLADRLFRDVEGHQRHTAQESLETMCRVVACISRAISDLEAEGCRVAARRTYEGRALRQRAEDDLTVLLNDHADGQSRLPAPCFPGQTKLGATGCRVPHLPTSMPGRRDRVTMTRWVSMVTSAGMSAFHTTSVRSPICT